MSLTYEISGVESHIITMHIGVELESRYKSNLGLLTIAQSLLK